MSDYSRRHLLRAVVLSALGLAVAVGIVWNEAVDRMTTWAEPK